jgi:ATP-dependent exoDNAse (exonuclease V), alpha subunit - helicase superfamily I member
MIGLSYTGKAAAEIEHKSGIPSRTITSFLQDEKNYEDREKIWIVDESSMTGSKQLHKLMKLAVEYNSKIVFGG